MGRGLWVVGAFFGLVGCAESTDSLVDIAHAPYQHCVETRSEQVFSTRIDTTTHYDEYGWLWWTETVRNGEYFYASTEYVREEGVVRSAEVAVWSERGVIEREYRTYDEHGHLEETVQSMAIGTPEAEGYATAVSYTHLTLPTKA